LASASLPGILLLRRPDEDHQALQQDAERHSREHGGEHHLAGHLAHQEHVDEHADKQAEHDGHGDGDKRIAGKGGRRRQQQIGAEHHQFAMRQIKYAADAIDEHITAGDQRVDGGQHDDVDDELHAAGSLVARMKRQRNPGAAFRRRHRPRISLCCIRAAN